VAAASSRVNGRDATVGYFDPSEPIANLTGNLPHWRQAGVTYFVTFRCADALPQEKLIQWKQELEQWLAEHSEPHDPIARKEFYSRFPERLQRWLDAGYGSCPLRDPADRGTVESALRFFDRQRYHLIDFVVAANHAHVIVSPLNGFELSAILHSWKSYTANQINRRRGLKGALWQKESFDHIVRSPESLQRFQDYIRAHYTEVKVAAASSRNEDQRQDAAAT
jgi:hypothetical protein